MLFRQRGRSLSGGGGLGDTLGEGLGDTLSDTLGEGLGDTLSGSAKGWATR